MAGNYFFDPRPFYGLNNHNLVPLDEIFYGRREIPPWLLPQKQHVHFEEYPRSRSVDHRRPDQYVETEDRFREYKRTEMRDDTYTNYQQQHDTRQLNGRSNSSRDYDMRSDIQRPKGHKDENWGSINSSNSKQKAQSQYNGRGQEKWMDECSDDDEYIAPRKSGSKNNKSSHNSSISNKHDNYNMGNQDSNGRWDESWSGNQRSHGQGGGGNQYPKSSAMKQSKVQKFLNRKDDSSDDDDDDYSYGTQKNNKGGQVHHGQKGAKQYNVRFDDQSYVGGHDSNRSSSKKTTGSKDRSPSQGNFNQQYGGDMDDSNFSHSSGKKGGSQQQGGLKKSKSKNESGGYSSEEDQWGHGHSSGKKSRSQQQGGLKKSKNKNDGYSSEEDQWVQYNQGTDKGGHQFQGGKESRGMDSMQKMGQNFTLKNGRSQSLELKVPICCDNCERKVRSALKHMPDVEQVLCDQWNRKVTVVGNVKAESVLKRLRKVKKDTQFWLQSKKF